MIHLVLHLPEEAMIKGPMYMRWIYPFERFLKKLKEYVKNRARPEDSIAKGYVVDKALTFCSIYLEGVRPSLINQIGIQVTSPLLNNNF